jgi:tetratricopeptide (TPR) repeat protein
MKSSLRTTRCVLAVVVVGMGMLSSVTADAESQAAARKYAAKANQLAAKNRCKAAVPWFNRAYRALKDPTLLFNRAECLRKLGENNDALQDYELFLVDMPQAPNRASVEAHIAALRAKLKTSAMAGSAQQARKEPDQAVSPSAPAPAEKSPSIEAAKRAEATGESGPSAPAKSPAAAAPAKGPAAVAPSNSPAASAPAKESSPAAAKPSDKAAGESIRRAEKWED